jgi:hypothetical protein
LGRGKECTLCQDGWLWLFWEDLELSWKAECNAEDIRLKD